MSYRDPQAKISRIDFIAWLKCENESRPAGCLLENWCAGLESGSKIKVKKTNKLATEEMSIGDVFSKFENLRCNEISILMSDKMAKMVIKRKTIEVAPAQLSLSEDSQGWKLLLSAAVNEGNLSNGLGKLNASSDLEAEKRKIKTVISRLRNNLKSSMGLVDNPIIFSKNTGCKFTFKVMFHELLKSNVSHDSDAMDYLDDYSANDRRRDNYD